MIQEVFVLRDDIKERPIQRIIYFEYMDIRIEKFALKISLQSVLTFCQY